MATLQAGTMVPWLTAGLQSGDVKRQWERSDVDLTRINYEQAAARDAARPNLARAPA